MAHFITWVIAGIILFAICLLSKNMGIPEGFKNLCGKIYNLTETLKSVARKLDGINRSLENIDQRQGRQEKEDHSREERLEYCLKEILMSVDSTLSGGDFPLKAQILMQSELTQEEFNELGFEHMNYYIDDYKSQMEEEE